MKEKSVVAVALVDCKELHGQIKGNNISHANAAAHLSYLISSQFLKSICERNILSDKPIDE